MSHPATVTHILRIKCPTALDIADCIAQLNLWNANGNLPPILNIKKIGTTKIEVTFADDIVEVE